MNFFHFVNIVYLRLVYRGFLTLLLVLLFIVPFFPVVGAAAQRTVVIDPGHGGDDPGAMDAANGIFERNINLQVARRTRAALAGKGMRVIMTRDDDELICMSGEAFVHGHIGLAERVGLANEEAGEVFLSIHANKFKDPDCSGAEVYYYHFSEESRILARTIQKALESLPNPIPCKIKPANYFVLRNTSMPAILAEIGYISHPEEGKLLLTPTYQQMLAKAFAQAVNSYLEESRLRRAGASG